MAEQSDMLAQKSTACRILNNKLSQLTCADIEFVLMAMICLSRVEPDAKAQPTNSASFLVPHMPCAEYVHLIGRLQWVDGLAKAMVTLVHRAGSLSRIRLPGLARRLAL